MASSSNPSKEFDDAMPTFDDFSTLLLNCDFSKWREIADCLKVPKITLSTITQNLGGDELRDKKAFLLILSSWREKALVTKEDRKATWRNLRNSLADFSDIVEQIEEIKEGWSEDGGVDLCDCKKPLALRVKKDQKKTLFKICPKPRKEQCENDHFDLANSLLQPKISNKVDGPPEHLHRTLLMKRNMELVNFAELAPHLIKQGSLTNDEYLDITQRNGVSSQQHFKIFVTEYLLKHGKRNIVQKFIAALRNEKHHGGHKDLLERIKQDERIVKATDKEYKNVDSVSKKRKRDEEGEKKDGPSKKKKKC